jgi:ribulose-phosphate 3-epimerase
MLSVVPASGIVASIALVTYSASVSVARWGPTELGDLLAVNGYLHHRRPPFAPRYPTAARAVFHAKNPAATSILAGRNSPLASRPAGGKIVRMHPGKLLVAPSLLAADAMHLADEVARAEAAGADLFHLDIMDNHFVPNLTFGPPLCAAVKKVARVPVVAHLMVERPESLVGPFLDAGADGVTVHAEASGDPLGAFERVLSAGRRAGVALKPDTPPEAGDRFSAQAGLVLAMTVFPGFGGQKYIAAGAEKLARIRTRARADAWLEVDGGINAETARHAVSCGANCLVAGTYVFGARDAAAAVQSLRAAEAKQGA